MATRDDAIRAIKENNGKLEPKIQWQIGYAGDGAGNVNTARANYYLVRYPYSNSPAVPVYCAAATFAPVDGQRVKVGYLPWEPDLFQIITASDQRLDINNSSTGSGTETPTVPGTSTGYVNLAPHAINHMYLGVDPVYINWRQITPLGVFPYSGLTVQIRGGYIPRPGADIYVADQTLDLTAHVPVSGARYALISFDSSGLPVVTNGTINAGGFSALTFADIPDTPAGNWRTCAIALYVGQTAIVETHSEIDFFDLRFPEESAADSAQTDLRYLKRTDLLTPPPRLDIFARSPDAVNSSVGTFGDATHAVQLTLDRYGRVTQAHSIPIVSREAMNMNQAAGGSGVTRSGATTDGHLAVWNGTSADSIKDGGAVPAGTTGDFLVMQVFS